MQVLLIVLAASVCLLRRSARKQARKLPVMLGK